MNDSLSIQENPPKTSPPAKSAASVPKAERKRLGEILTEQGVVTQKQLGEALKHQGENPAPLGEILIDLEIVTENVLLKALSRHLSVEFLNIAENDSEVIDPTLSHLLSKDVCRRMMVVPVFLLDDGRSKHLTLGMSDPLNVEAIEEVEQQTGATVLPVLTTSSAIKQGIDKLYSMADAQLEGIDEPGITTDDDTVNFVNRILVKAVQMRASDIHIEPQALETHMRLRIDGVLRLVDTYPTTIQQRTLSRLKVMGSEKNSLMRSEQRVVPQDGSFARVIAGHTVDFRVSTFPTIHGEKAVIRILDRDNVESINSISDVGMPPAIERKFTKCIGQASGIIIATGPTGSGKTTTLYAALNHINDVGKNIVTIEDPVEYHTGEFINQSSLKRESGFTYPVAIRSIMRQDPDAILVGEIRDLETAEAAIKSALTGHLVFTTLHTDDAAGAIVRLVDLGIEQFLVSSTIVSAINQRLLRKVCPYCRENYEPDLDHLIEIGIDRDVAEEIVFEASKFKIAHGKGCNNCYDSGYLGRLGAFELLTVAPYIKKLILDRETSDVIAEATRAKENINMIFEDGVRLALRGETTFDEVSRIPRGDYKMKSIKEIFEAAEDSFYS